VGFGTAFSGAFIGQGLTQCAKFSYTASNLNCLLTEAQAAERRSSTTQAKSRTSRDGQNMSKVPSSPDKRIRGRRAVALRKRRLYNEPLCRMCKAEGRTTIATVPDHIVPLAKGGEDVDSNIRCLCAKHHDQVTREEFGHRKRVTIGADGWPVSPSS
jgi:5-methylcytosine-specific restriction protein A